MNNIYVINITFIIFLVLMYTDIDPIHSLSYPGSKS